MISFKKPLIPLGCTLACLTSISPSPAVEFRDIDAIGAYLKKSGSDAQKKVSGTFDIVLGDGSVNVSIGSPYLTSPQTFSDISGFQPDDYTITEAIAYFYFRDDASDNEQEEVRIKFQKNSDDRGFGAGNEYQFDAGQISNKSFSIFSDSLNATLLTALEDGVIHYEIQVDKGDLYFDYARLDVFADWTPRVSAAADVRTSVPDYGSTVGLMLLGGLGIAALARRLR